MRLVVVIPTFGRKSLLARLLRHLEAQSSPPHQVVISAPDESHVAIPEPLRYRVQCAFGGCGSSAQRNKALDLIAASSEYIIFLDDDFVPADDYLERAAACLAAHPEWGALTGRVLVDGIKGLGLSFDEGLRILQAHGCTESGNPVVLHGAYGCNMAMRTADIADKRFDERLPLYGWQEDTDFSRRVAGARQIVRCDELRGVHLGVKGGRVSGIRFGYSQIANPSYLVTKGTVSTKWAVSMIARNVAANVFHSFWPEPHIDRLGRLRGNLLAATHVVRGRIEPEFIVKL
jgi:GT2 family glycosyltransferase